MPESHHIKINIHEKKFNIKYLEITAEVVQEEGDGYYLPYVPDCANAITLPLKLKNGTVVLSDPFNGCAVQVDKQEGALIFSHDADGKYLHRSSHTLFRAEYKDYAGPGDRAFQLAEKLLIKNKKPANFSINIFFIKQDSIWRCYQNTVVYQARDSGGYMIYHVLKVLSLLGTFREPLR